jgi:hypothetical protein
VLVRKVPSSGYFFTIHSILNVITLNGCFQARFIL